MTRHLLYGYFPLRTAHFYAKVVKIRIRVSLMVRVSSRSGGSTTDFKDAIDFLCFERR